MSDLHAAIEHFENNPALRREFAYTLQAMKDARDALVQKQTVIDEMLESLDEAKFTEPELRAKLDKQRQRIEQLEKQVYLAGHWSCPKCKFYLVSTNLHVSSGGFSANNEPQQCANGCGPMWKVTHEQSADTMVDRCEKQTDRIEQLEAAFGRLLMQLANNTKVAVKMFDEIIEAKQVLETAGDTLPPQPQEDIAFTFVKRIAKQPLIEELPEEAEGGDPESAYNIIVYEARYALNKIAPQSVGVRCKFCEAIIGDPEVPHKCIFEPARD